MTIVLSIILSIVCLLIIVSYLHHYIQLMKEETLIQPLGQLVEVNDHQLHVYTEGNGKETLVFLAGGGTSSPVLDFKSLYTLLSDQYKIVVIEKGGYGFSEITDRKRDIATILSETREVLQQAKITGPFILLPHSMSGLESLY